MPYDCSFFDVIYLYGRRPRHKPVENVIADVADLERRQVRNVFFSDDNFYGNPKYAKELLRALIPVNNAFAKPGAIQHSDHHERLQRRGVAGVDGRCQLHAPVHWSRDSQHGEPEGSQHRSHIHEPGGVVFPATFRKSYKVSFPEIHDRLSKGLNDKARLYDALVEVFGDFVLRWGPTFTEFEEHHREFSFEICDRAIDKENGTTPGQEREAGELPRATELPPSMRNVKAFELPDEILRIVEQDLRTATREEGAPGRGGSTESLPLIQITRGTREVREVVA